MLVFFAADHPPDLEGRNQPCQILRCDYAGVHSLPMLPSYPYPLSSVEGRFLLFEIESRGHLPLDVGSSYPAHPVPYISPASVTVAALYYWVDLCKIGDPSIVA